MYFYTKRYFTLTILFFIIVHTLQSQSIIKGRIVEKDTKTAVAFATVIYEKQGIKQGVISDIYGNFEIDEAGLKNITVSCVGYKSRKVTLNVGIDESNLEIELELNPLDINEVTVSPDDNPAIRIIKKALLNKEKNNFENLDQFKYQCYFKTLYDAKASNIATKRDTIAILNHKVFHRRALFVSEMVAICKHANHNSENKIIASKFAGFEDAMLNQNLFSLFHHRMSFYNNLISILELPVFEDKSVTNYIGPLSDGCLNSYYFQLEDSYEEKNDSIFVINFYPKRGKNSNCLKGKMLISANGFAIKTIIAEPVEKGLIDFRFCQNYEFSQNKWFPRKLDEEITFTSIHLKGYNNVHAVFLINSRIDNVTFDPSISKIPIKLENVYVDENSIVKSDSILNSVRSDSLTVREKYTYQVMDSIGKKYHFDYWLGFFPKLVNGSIPIKYFDIDLANIYKYNNYEGSRWGIGLFTNEKLSKFVSLGGFAGYGLKDEKMKHGEEIDFTFDRYKDFQLKISHQNNLKEVGLETNTLALYNYNRGYIGYRFDHMIEDNATVIYRPFRFVKLSASMSLRELNPLYNYSYKGSPLNNYRADNFQISVKYAYHEDLATIGGQRITNFEGNPILNLTYRRGTTLFNKNSYAYNALEATLDVVAYNGKIGQSTIRLATGIIDRSLPYGLLFTGEGSMNKEIPLVINNSFQTMPPYEFLSDSYLNLFFSHNFGSLLFKTHKFKPQFVIVQNTAWGNLKNASFQGIDFKIKNKVYLESGLMINNIIKINFNTVYFGFGFGAFYRYGYYGYDAIRDNFAFKMSTSVTFR